MLDDSADWCGGLRVAEQRGGTARLRSLYHCRRSPAELREGRQQMNRADFAAVGQRLRNIDAA
jgi:hypothetical protein